AKSMRIVSISRVLMVILCGLSCDGGIDDQQKLTDKLVAAAAQDDVNAVRALLRQGVDPNGEADGEQTPLMAACRTPGTEVIGVLLQAGADPDKRDKNGMTALMIAVSSGRADVAKQLLAAGVDRGVRDLKGR